MSAAYATLQRVEEGRDKGGTSMETSHLIYDTMRRQLAACGKLWLWLRPKEEQERVKKRKREGEEEKSNVETCGNWRPALILIAGK